MVRFIEVVVRKGLFPMRSMNDLPEVQRLQWVAGACRENGMPPLHTAVIVLIDAAIRSPAFSRAPAWAPPSPPDAPWLAC